mmetsp:Transcript_23892/g.52686  ORF Transcript_23892/g.52686 Transcript_23892/m.52686 type:complete len:466 (-) Transcript_23892:88-1485(-)
MGNVPNGAGILGGEPDPDEAFSQKYEVDANRLGSGKFSEVFKCWQRGNPQTKFALKVIKTNPGDHAGVTRIFEEINILKALGRHPAIMYLVDFDDASTTRIRLVLELCEGGELYDRMQKKGYYQENEAKILVINLLQAVAYIHSKGIMHRDLKPENILLARVDSDTEIKISDFGLAKQSKDYPRRLPRCQSICGSDFYLAPEIIKQEEYGREVDLWAVGVVTYVLLAGTLPFFHTVLHKLYRQIVERDISFPEEQWGKVSKGAPDFVLRLLQGRPGDRLAAEQALNHPWLRTTAPPQEMPEMKRATGAHFEHAHAVGANDRGALDAAVHEETTPVIPVEETGPKSGSSPLPELPRPSSLLPRGPPGARPPWTRPPPPGPPLPSFARGFPGGFGPPAGAPYGAPLYGVASMPPPGYGPARPPGGPPGYGQAPMGSMVAPSPFSSLSVAPAYASMGPPPMKGRPPYM